MNLTASLSLQVLCQLIGSRGPYSNDASIVVSNPLAITNQSPPPVQPATLPDGYIAYPEIGAAYKIVFNELTWSQAREQCNLDGAHLAALDSKKKLEYVGNATYCTYRRSSSYVVMHTGMYRMDQKWVDVSTGTTLSDLPWLGGYPMDSHGDCSVVQILQTGVHNLYNEEDCSRKHFYLCEVPIFQNYKSQENQMARIAVN